MGRALALSICGGRLLGEGGFLTNSLEFQSMKYISARWEPLSTLKEGKSNQLDSTNRRASGLEVQSMKDIGIN
jgi:hypothetical protein